MLDLLQKLYRLPRHPPHVSYSFVILSSQLPFSWSDWQAKDSTGGDRVEDWQLSLYYDSLQSSSQPRGRQSCRVQGLPQAWTSLWSGHRRQARQNTQWTNAFSPHCWPSNWSSRPSAVTLSFWTTFLHLYFLVLQIAPGFQFTATGGAASFSFEILIDSV